MADFFPHLVQSDFSLKTWLFFGITLVLLMFSDLFLFKNNHDPEKVFAAWFGVAIAFLFALHYIAPQYTLAAVTSYLIEFSLSIDNLFLIYMVFQAFNIKNSEHQHIILTWGLLGAMIMRLIFIFIGVELIRRFTWIIPVFGGILIYSAINIVLRKLKELKKTKENTAASGAHHEQAKGFFSKLGLKIIEVDDKNPKITFLMRKNGKIIGITNLLAALIYIEKIDLVLAIDSIPAIIAIAKEPFVVFFANILSLLGLRSLFLVISKYVAKFSFLPYSISFILVFIGSKMVLEWFGIHIHASIALIVPVLAIAAPLIYIKIQHSKAKR